MFYNPSVPVPRDLRVTLEMITLERILTEGILLVAQDS
jgi:hypothetical protein